MNFYVEDTGDYLGVEPLMDTDTPLLPRGQVGKPYIIKVGKEADIKTRDDEYTFPWDINTNVKVNGPIYQVKGVAISSLMATSRRLPTWVVVAI